MQVNIRIGLGTVIAVAAIAAAAVAFTGVREKLGYAFDWLKGEHVISTSVESTRDSFVIPTNGGFLEVARVKAYERFSKTDDRKRGFVDLGTTISEVEVAALFRYQIPMDKEWPVTCEKNVCVVRAGAVTPSPPAAIYTEETKTKTQSGWARFNKRDNLALLERELQPRLDARATLPRNVHMATDEARKTVAQFVKTWMVKEKGGSSQSSPRIVVLFPGEELRAEP